MADAGSTGISGEQRPAHRRAAASSVRTRSNLIARLSAAAGLTLVTPGDLTIERRRAGDGFAYVRKNGKFVTDKSTKRRLDRLAVPPAYVNVFCAADPKAHIQAVGTDSAGRLQYRYHADWTTVREALKARRLTHLVEALPLIRRTVAQDLHDAELTRRRALAAAIRMVERTAIRAGNHAYERISGSRGVATLCKSNTIVAGEDITLTFKAKGNKRVKRNFADAELAAALRELCKLPGKRLFQFKENGNPARAITTSDLNAYLKDAAGRPISTKDFRTLIASSAAVEALSEMAPAKSERRRRSQILEAVRLVAEELDNTPAVARRSYIHASVIDAFEEGRLLRLKRSLKARPFSPRRERLLLSVVRAAATI
jgi:DNA topoisomerase-1